MLIINYKKKEVQRQIEYITDNLGFSTLSNIFIFIYSIVKEIVIQINDNYENIVFIIILFLNIKFRLELEQITNLV